MPEDSKQKSDIERMREALAKAFPAGVEGRDGWLQAIYAARSSRFTGENATIWTMGAVMIPTAFGLFGFAAGQTLVISYSLVATGVLSIATMLAWLAIAENYRAFQNKSLLVVQAIESEVGFVDPVGIKLVDQRAAKSARLIELFPVRKVRWWMFWLLVGAWIALIGVAAIWPEKATPDPSAAVTQIAAPTVAAPN